MLTTKSKILIGSFSRSPNPSSPASPPHFIPFYVYIFPDPAEKSGAFQLTLRSRDLTYFLDLSAPFNVVSESTIPQSYVNSHSHHFRTAPPTADEFNDDYYSFSALRACAISLGRHDLEELCKLRIDDIQAGKYHSALSKNRVVVPEKVPTQSTFQFHVVNITTPMSTTSLSPRSDHGHSPTFSRNMRIKEEPTSPPPPPPSLSHSPETRRRPAPMLLTSATHKNIGLAILSPGLPPRATTDPDSRKQLVEADAIRAQQQALIDQRRNQTSNKTSVAPATPSTAKRTPKTLSTNARSTKRARAPPNITIDGSAGKSNPDISIQSAPLYPPRGTLFNKSNGDSGPMTSALYHSNKESSFPYSIPHRRGPSDPMPMGGIERTSNTSQPSSNWNHQDHSRPPFRPSPPRLPSISATFNSIPHPPPTPQTPSTLARQPTRVAARWLEGKSIRPRRRARSDQDLSSSDDSDTPVTIHLGEKVTMTKLEWLQRGHDLLERAWNDMVLHEKGKAVQQQQQQQPQPQQRQPNGSSGSGASSSSQ